jgi:hypothetical protein
VFSSRPTTVTTTFCRRFSLSDPKLFLTNLVVYDGAVEGNDPQQRQQRFASIPAGKEKRESLNSTTELTVLKHSVGLFPCGTILVAYHPTDLSIQKEQKVLGLTAWHIYQHS